MTPCPLCGHEKPEANSVCAACGEGEPVEREETDGSYFGRLQRHTRRCLIVFYLLAALNGVAIAFEWYDADFLLGGAAGLTAAVWVITDASDRGQPLRWFARLVVIFFGGLSAFFYLVITRHVRGLGWFILHATAYVVVIAAPALMFDMLFAESEIDQRNTPVLLPESAELPPLPAN